MKKQIISFLIIGALVGTLAGCSHHPSHCMKTGAPEITTDTNPMVKTPNQNNVSNEPILVLYAQPNMNSTVLGQVTPQTQFNYQPIFRNGTWLEVLNTQTGQVGWINMKDQIEAAQKRQAALRQMQEMQKMATAPAMNPANAQQYQSTQVTYSGNNKDATVTSTWRDKDGKLQTKTMQIPADKMSHLEIVNGQVVSS